MAGSQNFAADPRNAHTLIYLNGTLVPRERASVSIFEGGFVVGDGIWEGLRLHKGALLFLNQRLDRLYWGAAYCSRGLGKATIAVMAEYKVANPDIVSVGVHLATLPFSKSRFASPCGRARAISRPP